MDRKNFLTTCGYALVGIPLAITLLDSCGGLHYATVNDDGDSLILNKDQFIINPEKPEKTRDFVLVQSNRYKFPICVYKISDKEYVASLMKCTHRGCELNVGGGIYSCPCHGSEFSKEGEVLSGPADQKLITFITKTNAENITIYLS